jgi:hypothetical protein
MRGFSLNDLSSTCAGELTLLERVTLLPATPAPTTRITLAAHGFRPVSSIMKRLCLAAQSAKVNGISEPAVIELPSVILHIYEY